MTTSFKRVSAQGLEFAKLRPRGAYQFCSISYKGSQLTIETPAMITPTGIHADEARNWMDVELDISTNNDHLTLFDMFRAIDDRCIDECKMDQAKLDQDASGSGPSSDAWEGRYGKLL